MLSASQPEIDRAAAAYAEIVRRINPRLGLLRWTPLPGGVSAQTLLLEAVDAEQASDVVHRWVLRRQGSLDVAANPDVAAKEFALLHRLYALGLAVPKPYLVDQTGKLLPGPYVLLAYVDGAPDFAPQRLDDYVAQAARQLVATHAVGGNDSVVAALPCIAEHVRRRLVDPPTDLDRSLSEDLIRAVLTPDRMPPHTGQVLLHGDYWPGNLLWRSGHLTAVIDWEDAMRGDPLADLGNARLELLWALGADAMHAFTRRYLAETHADARGLAFWDLWAALRPASKLSSWGLAEAVKTEMRDKHRWFVAHALERFTVE